MFDKSTKSSQYNNSSKSISLEDSARSSLLNAQRQEEPLIMPRNQNRINSIDKQMIKLEDNKLKIKKSNYESPESETIKRSDALISEIKESVLKNIINIQFNKNKVILEQRAKEQIVSKNKDIVDNGGVQVFKIKKIKNIDIKDDTKLDKIDSKIKQYSIFGLGSILFILYKLKRK